MYVYIYEYIYTSGDFDRIYRFSALFSRRASPPQEISRAAKFALKSIPSDSLLSLRNDRRPNDCLNPAVYGQKGEDAKRTRERERERPKESRVKRKSLYYRRASWFSTRLSEKAPFRCNAAYEWRANRGQGQIRGKVRPRDETRNWIRREWFSQERCRVALRVDRREGGRDFWPEHGNGTPPSRNRLEQRLIG